MPTPITIITGFLGSGKTTLILSLLPQLRALNPSYKLALLKNEFGSLAIDSQLASSTGLSVRELLNGCICCNLVGSLSSTIGSLLESESPDRIVIETSGSAFPATLAMEVNRIARETGKVVLDGVVSVVDVENWTGYGDTSFTAGLQVRYTDLVVFNKWEGVGERRWEECLDRWGDLEGGGAWVRSRKGWVDVALVVGIDGGLAGKLARGEEEKHEEAHKHEEGHKHAHGDEDHQSEVEVLSITLEAEAGKTVDTAKLSKLLKAAPKDEVYRIKAVLTASTPLAGSDDAIRVPVPEPNEHHGRYILNWAFSRWTCTPLPSGAEEHESSQGVVLRMTMILARYESTKWKKRLLNGGLVELEGGGGKLSVEKIG